MKLKALSDGEWISGDPPLVADDRRDLLRAMRHVRRPASSGAEWAHHHVYVILLGEVPSEPAFSFYVGMTGLSPEERYQRHVAGIQAGRKRVQRYGLGLLPDLYERFNPMSDPDARIVERDLGEALKGAGFTVHWA